MTMIAAYPGLSNADIARLSFLTPQTVSVIIGNLVKAGVVARRPHEIHGRIQHLDLTDKGQRLLRSARERVHAVENELVKGASAADLKMLKHWLAGVSSKLTPD